MKPILLTAALASLLAGAAPAAAQAQRATQNARTVEDPRAKDPRAKDPRAKDVADIFVTMCLRPLGRPDYALAAFAKDSEISKRLPEDAARRFNGGRAGGPAWELLSPRKASMVLSYDPLGLCVLRVAEADAPSVRGAFADAIGLFAHVIGARAEEPTFTKTGAGADQRTMVDFRINKESARTLVTLSSLDRPKGGLQHLVTFAWVKD